MRLVLAAVLGAAVSGCASWWPQTRAAETPAYDPVLTYAAAETPEAAAAAEEIIAEPPGAEADAEILEAAAVPFPSLAPRAAHQTGERAPFDPGRAGFSVQVRDMTVSYRVFGVFALPGEAVLLRPSVPVQTRIAAGRLHDGGADGLVWSAPREAGLYPVTLTAEDGAEILLNAFVMTPASDIRRGALEGYAIGDYPAEPFRGLAEYAPPQGFVRVTEDVLNTPVAPHFTLAQFLCKQEAAGPKYAVVRERLLLVLERMLEAVNQNGWRTDSFEVMSGYRTPVYNAGLRNSPNSRHVYGGAADIYIDVSPRDGRMDDLNGDGERDWRDAAVLYDFFEELVTRPEWADLQGGIGAYPPTRFHGGFVHVDERGWPARWGRSRPSS